MMRLELAEARMKLLKLTDLVPSIWQYDLIRLLLLDGRRMTWHIISVINLLTEYFSLVCHAEDVNISF